MLGISRQAYYKWQSSPVCQRDWDDAHLIDAALDIHADDPADGYRVHRRRTRPARVHRLGEPGVADLLDAADLLAARQEERTFPQGGAAGARRPRAPRLHRHRTEHQVATDITEHPTGEGKLYLCAVKDCYSNKIVGYSIASHMRASLALSALRNAIALRDPRDVVVHSDRGAQFRSAAYRSLLRSHALTGSMGRVGACGDNAAMESFFSLLQKNVLDTRRWETREELRLAIVSWRSTTANAANAPWASSPRSSLRPSTPPQQRPEKQPAPVSTEVWADPTSERDQAGRRRAHDCVALPARARTLDSRVVCRQALSRGALSATVAWMWCVVMLGLAPCWRLTTKRECTARGNPERSVSVGDHAGK
ncbi:IS3 family transposase [Amycolatopsis sp. NPDC001319]|uniref:IS3 family transposase n=1 Tax=unclassified Amycolatopsis TaxID=2618356 RepID=UPI0036C16102